MVGKYLEKTGKVFYREVKVPSYKNGKEIIKRKLIGGNKVFCPTPKEEFEYKEFDNERQARKYFCIFD